MGLYFSSLKRQLVPTAIIGTIYFIALVVTMLMCNSNSLIYFKIDPYQYGSEPIDFFWGLLVTVPFSVSTFFLKKDNFLDCVALRISKQKYIQNHIIAILTMCFAMVFLVNMGSVIFSCLVANIDPGNPQNGLSEYILGTMQAKNPILFGVIWSFHKAFVGVGICLFAQIIALYVDNLFLALLAPYAYIILENYLTAIIGFPDFSLTTAIVLNRLQPNAMRVWKIAISMGVFVLVMYIVHKKLRNDYEEKS
ncbi:MAG: hypothetical protein RR313_02765 [Anaerovoracaceae bacterium]